MNAGLDHINKCIQEFKNRTRDIFLDGEKVFLNLGKYIPSRYMALSSVSASNLVGGFKVYDDILSNVYYVEGNRAVYRADYFLFAKPLNETQTLLRVEALAAEVRVGKTLAIGHAWEKWVYESIAPTTLEENELLEQVVKCVLEK